VSPDVVPGAAHWQGRQEGGCALVPSSLFVGCFLAVRGASEAQPAADHWRLRGGAALAVPGDGGFDTLRPNGKRVRTDLTSGLGLHLEIERLLGPRHDSLYAGGALHLTPGRRADAFVQALIVRASYADLVLASAGPP
jgi:hypothetical protein